MDILDLSSALKSIDFKTGVQQNKRPDRMKRSNSIDSNVSYLSTILIVRSSVEKTINSSRCSRCRVAVCSFLLGWSPQCNVLRICHSMDSYSRNICTHIVHIKMSYIHYAFRCVLYCVKNCIHWKAKCMVWFFFNNTLLIKYLITKSLSSNQHWFDKQITHSSGSFKTKWYKHICQINLTYRYRMIY